MMRFSACTIHRWFSVVFLGAVVSLTAMLPRGADAAPDRRVALVIGNGSYRSVPALPNPVNDAKSVATALKRLGFDVTEGYDLPIAEMRTTLANFSASLPDAKAALIYYAGHGVSVDGENYLVPVDMVLNSPVDLDLGAISMSLLLKQLKREERVSVVILDACRDNPFAGDLSKGKTRAMVGDRGLSRIDSDLAKGTLIAFASDPKSVALDGKPGENSPFTGALLHHMEDPGVSIDTVMNRVRSEVWEDTKNQQMPWVSTSIIGEFILNPQPTAATPAAAAATPPSAAAVPAPAAVAALPAPVTDRFGLENRLWDSAERGNAPEDYRAYLDAYPRGLYAQMAKSRIARLTPAKPEEEPHKESATAAVPVTTPLQKEVGTQDTEAALGMDREARRELQARLAALAFDIGPVNGTLDGKARVALTAWQKQHGAEATGWLGPLQYAALKQETETSYRSFLVTPDAPQHLARSRSISHVATYHSYRPRHVYYARARSSGGHAGGGMDPAGAAFLGGMLGGVIGHFR